MQRVVQRPGAARFFSGTEKQPVCAAGAAVVGTEHRFHRVHVHKQAQKRCFIITGRFNGAQLMGGSSLKDVVHLVDFVSSIVPLLLGAV